MRPTIAGYSSLVDNMMHTPTGKLSREWPEPQGFPEFLERHAAE